MSGPESDATKMVSTETRSPQDIKALALDIQEGRVFGSWHLKKTDEWLLSSIFLPLMFLEPEQVEEMAEVAHIFEYIDRAGPRSINGYPAFMSFHRISHTEWDTICKLLNKLHAQRTEFLNEDD
jgi:hypothetical protein